MKQDWTEQQGAPSTADSTAVACVMLLNNSTCDVIQNKSSDNFVKRESVSLLLEADCQRRLFLKIYFNATTWIDQRIDEGTIYGWPIDASNPRTVEHLIDQKLHRLKRPKSRLWKKVTPFLTALIWGDQMTIGSCSKFSWGITRHIAICFRLALPHERKISLHEELFSSVIVNFSREGRRKEGKPNILIKI